MERTQILDKVLELIARDMSKNRDELSGETTIESLNMDSLDKTELVMEFEDEFDISVTDKKAEKIIESVTINDIVEALYLIINDFPQDGDLDSAVPV